MVKINDMTMKQTAEGFSLSFREKIEVSKLLDKLGADVIELEGIHDSRTDSLRIKSIATAVSDSIVAVPVALNESSVEQTWNALGQAKHPRLQVCVPVSVVQMEYLFHQKPDAMLKLMKETVSACAKLAETEFVAQDATRSEPAFLYQAISAAIEAGATVVTLMDSAGAMLPEEFATFLTEIYASVPQLSSVTLGVGCSNALSMADSCIIAAVKAGAREVKAASVPVDCASLANITRIIAAKGDNLGVQTGIQVNQLERSIEQITRMCHKDKVKASSFVTGNVEGTELFLTMHDDSDAVNAAAQQLGYDLSQEDLDRVYEAFRQIAEKKSKVGIRELDAIIASAAMQVPPTYTLDNYVITSGSAVAATAHIKLLKNGVPMEGVYLGDGPIDAAFLTIEKITGLHFELDDFQIQAVTEGREAMGQTVVKLRASGKVYSGRGISTDIACASIHAYLSALNKIVYEEDVV